MYSEGKDERSAALPYGGDIQAAMRHEDRDAIRAIMSAAGTQPTASPTREPTAKLTLDDFTCSICTELLYKPCVSACGHAFCFWCLHKAMDPMEASQCPLCRQGFKHFAAPVAAFHRLLSARFPEQMAIRAEQVADAEENEFKAKSMIASVASSATESGVAADDARMALTCVSCGHLASPPLVLNCGHLTCGACLDGASRGGRVRRCPADGCGARVVCEPKPCQLALALMHAEVPAAALALAEAAAEAYKATTAESAAAAIAATAVKGATSAASATTSDAAEGETPMEQEPTSPAPSAGATLVVAAADGGSASDTAANVAEAASTPLPRGGGAGAAAAEARMIENYTHFGVGCDGCGVYPIRGARWRCLDCPEEIGFDLCGFCHEAAIEDGGGGGGGGEDGGVGCGGGAPSAAASPLSTVEGRFGQVHTSAHRMQEQPRPMTWIHTLQATHPELSVHEVVDLVRRAVGSGFGGGAEAALQTMLGPTDVDDDEPGEDVD